MSEVVYIFGAGINRAFSDSNGLQAPLANDLFQQGLRHHLTGNQDSRTKLRELFTYIEHYWKFSTEDLERYPFDLEACYTLIQQQRQELKDKSDQAAYRRASLIEYQLSTFLMSYLANIEPYASLSYGLQRLGKKMFRESAAVLSFNYDTIIELFIEFASGEKIGPDPVLERDDVGDDDLTDSGFHWNRALAYEVQFDEVELQRVGRQRVVSGERFFSHPKNKPYKNPFLKLHGSLNWFIHTSIPKDDEKAGETNKKAGTMLLTSNFPWLSYQLEPPHRDGWLLEPLVVTPVMNKELSKGIIRDVWQRAGQELSSCKRLVIGGLSFAPTDFAVRKLLLESFADNNLEELVLINPDPSVADTASKLCHVGTPTVFHNVDQFVDSEEA